MSEALHSAIYTGIVRHRRFSPVPHEFQYRLYQVYLDLAELPRLFTGARGWGYERRGLGSFRRADYAADPATPLDSHIRQRVLAETGELLDGPIRMLTHLRYFGYVFNPVTFYYCFERDGETLRTVVAEITNTPWSERHSYILPETANQTPGPHKRWTFGKAFHVSPFMPMAVDYDWRFGTPGDRLAVHMINLQEGERVFDATLDLQRREWTPGNLNRCLVGYPLMTARVMAAIYWQALRLKLKGVRVHDHPADSHTDVATAVDSTTP